MLSPPNLEPHSWNWLTAEEAMALSEENVERYLRKSDRLKRTLYRRANVPATLRQPDFWSDTAGSYVTNRSRSTSYQFEIAKTRLALQIAVVVIIAAAATLAVRAIQTRSKT